MSDLIVTKNLLVECENVRKVYKEGNLETEVLKGVSFNIHTSEMVAIVGASGSGKSTLLHILGARDSLSAGTVRFMGKDLAKMPSADQAKLRNNNLGFIYQFHHLLTDFSAEENIAMPLLIGGMKSVQAKERARHLLEAVGLSHRASHKPSELSGGERQRVAIARAVINRPNLVLADEPTGNLDHKTALGIYDLMRKLNQEFNIAFLVVTHDQLLAHKMDRQLTMLDGEFVEPVRPVRTKV